MKKLPQEYCSSCKCKDNQKEHRIGIIELNMPEGFLFAIVKSSFPQSITEDKKNRDWQNIIPLYTPNIEEVIFTKIYSLFSLV